MKRISILALAGILMVSVTIGQAVTEVSVETMPPVVVRTVPEAGDTEVEPALKEIRVTFSKDMMTEKMWSWCQISNETFPKVTGDIRYLEDKRTCVAPVGLEPGKAYVIWFNRGKYNSFRDEDNNPAIPYQLVFQTKKSGAETSKSNAGNRRIGSRCSYSNHLGTATITRVEKTQRSTQQAKASGGPGYEGYEIWFSFKTDQEIKQDWARDKVKREHLFQLLNSWYPGSRYLEKYKIKPGNSYTCTLKVITKGTCTPIIFEFSELKMNDYFETKR